MQRYMGTPSRINGAEIRISRCSGLNQLSYIGSNSSSALKRDPGRF